MSKSDRKLDQLAELLETTGGDPKRLEAVRRTQRFRRSWIELAEFLCEIRKSKAHEAWGFKDFQKYCTSELTLKRATVDKLTVSYATLQHHAPQVLKRDGVAKTIPSYESIDYFSKAVDKPKAANNAANNAGGPVPAAPTMKEETLKELSAAVFEENQPVRELRKRFDSVFFPQPKGSTQLAVLESADKAAKKLSEILVAEIEGISPRITQALEVEIAKFREQVGELKAPLKAKSAKRKAPKKPEAVAS